MKHMAYTAAVAFLLLSALSCSRRKVDDRFVGHYISADKSEFFVEYKGDCGITEPPKSGGSRYIPGRCSMSGNTLTFSGDPADSIYPEFRDGTATLTADGDSFVTETGRKFLKRGSSNSTASTTSTSQSTTTDVLTTERAQAAIDKFVNANRGSGGLSIRGGVREVSSENRAVAELDLSDFCTQAKCFTPLKGYAWQGKAIFSKYTDSRWVLTQIVFTFIGDSTTFSLNIDA